MIEIHDLEKAYRTSDVETTALNHINLEIDTGEFIAIMGPSGCGKSTLLNVIGMLDSPDSGRYGFLGQDVAGKSETDLAISARRTSASSSRASTWLTNSQLRKTSRCRCFTRKFRRSNGSSGLGKCLNALELRIEPTTDRSSCPADSSKELRLHGRL